MADEPRVNRPESGAYGEKADLQRLRQSLPPMEAQRSGGAPGGPAAAGGRTPGAPPGLPASPTGRPPGPTPPPGLPRALGAPGTGQPPPMMQSPMSQAAGMPSDQRTLFLLDMLASSPEVSPDTREWAGTVLSLLLDAPDTMNTVI